MDRQDIVAIFARRDRAWAAHDAAALAAFHAEDAVGDSPMQGRLEGRARIHGVYEAWLRAFPDLTFTSLDLVIDDFKVAQFFSIRATQAAPFGGIPSTGRRIDFNGAWLYTLARNGLIIADRRFYDVTTLLMQLGMLKAKPDAPEHGHSQAARQ